jgi:hypothetical protein
MPIQLIQPDREHLGIIVIKKLFQELTGQWNCSNIIGEYHHNASTFLFINQIKGTQQWQIKS